MMYSIISIFKAKYCCFQCEVSVFSFLNKCSYDSKIPKESILAGMAPNQMIFGGGCLVCRRFCLIKRLDDISDGVQVNF